MSRIRRTAIDVAALAVTVALLAMLSAITGPRLTPTHAAWNDVAAFTATATTGVWPGVDVSDGGISVGNATTVISDIAWDVRSPTRFCVDVTVTGTSPTPQPWQLDVDLTRAPFNGVSVGDVTVRRAVKTAGPDSTMILTGTMRPNRPFNARTNNSPITNAQQAVPRMCVTTTTPALGDPSWYTVDVAPGTGATWSDTTACLTLTVTTAITDLALNPFFSGWQMTLDLAPALARITGAGGTPDAVTWSPGPNGGANFTTVPATYDPVQPSYDITSGPNLAIRGLGSGDETATVTACVVDFG